MTPPDIAVGPYLAELRERFIAEGLLWERGRESAVTDAYVAGWSDALVAFVSATVNGHTLPDRPPVDWAARNGR